MPAKSSSSDRRIGRHHPHIVDDDGAGPDDEDVLPLAIGGDHRARRAFAEGEAARQGVADDRAAAAAGDLVDVDTGLREEFLPSRRHRESRTCRFPNSRRQWSPPEPPSDSARRQPGQRQGTP